MVTKWCLLRLGPSIRPRIRQLCCILTYWVLCVRVSDEIVPSVVAHLGLHCFTLEGSIIWTVIFFLKAFTCLNAKENGGDLDFIRVFTVF